MFRYVATCFAYGQTGSGKTHTMVGPGGAAIVGFVVCFLANKCKNLNASFIVSYGCKFS